MIRNVTFRHLLLALGLVALTACSPSDTPSPQAVQQAKQAEAAQRNLETYRQLLKIHNDEVAVMMGKDILKRFPDSAAAKEVNQTLPAIEKRYLANSEKLRLERLWMYQVAPMAGGTQSTASINSSQPSGNDRVRLVLRRHTDWGLSVFLYGTEPGFTCRGNCALKADVDGKPEKIKAFAPEGGEPALMIRDAKAFIAMLEQADKISLDVTLAGDGKHETLVYEVAGFDPAKWKKLDKHD